VYFPNPPVHTLNQIERLLELHDRPLVEHFRRTNATAHEYGWPLLQTLFSQVLERGEWIVIMDHIWSSKPEFMLTLVVAYLHCFRGPLLDVHNVTELKAFLLQNNPVDLRKLLASARAFFDKTAEEFWTSDLPGGEGAAATPREFRSIGKEVRPGVPTFVRLFVCFGRASDERRRFALRDRDSACHARSGGRGRTRSSRTTRSSSSTSKRPSASGSGRRRRRWRGGAFWCMN
jgi:hypothetical protein